MKSLINIRHRKHAMSQLNNCLVLGNDEEMKRILQLTDYIFTVIDILKTWWAPFELKRASMPQTRVITVARGSHLCSSVCGS